MKRTHQNPIWTCKIGIIGPADMEDGCDLPMREAVEKAFKEITGVDAQFNFSGWGGKLDETETEIVTSIVT